MRPAAAPDAREQYLIALMAPPNSIWDSIIQQAVVNPDVLKQQEVIKSLQNVLQVGLAVGCACGSIWCAPGFVDWLLLPGAAKAQQQACVCCS